MRLLTNLAIGLLVASFSAQAAAIDVVELKHPNSNKVVIKIRFDNGSIAQVNLLHYPRKGVLIGGELLWGEREDVSGEDGYDVRVQMSLKVNFPLED